MPYSGYISLLVIIYHYFSLLSLLRDTHYCCLVSLIGFFCKTFHYCCEFRIHINRHYFQLIFDIVYYCLDLKSKRTVTNSSIIGLIAYCCYSLLHFYHSGYYCYFCNHCHYCIDCITRQVVGPFQDSFPLLQWVGSSGHGHWKGSFHQALSYRRDKLCSGAELHFAHVGGWRRPAGGVWFAGLQKN